VEEAENEKMSVELIDSLKSRIQEGSAFANALDTLIEKQVIETQELEKLVHQ